MTRFRRRPTHRPTLVVPPGFGPVLRALLAGDEAGVSDAVLALCRDRARAGCSQSAFRSDLERTWRAVGKRLPASYLALAATVWEQGPEHAA